MIALTSPYLWYTTRATGLVALVLFTVVVCLGAFVSNRVGGTNVGRFELNELHRSVSMVAVAFLVLHILTTVLDSYVPTGWLSAVIPMTSSYKRFDVALGAVAFDLILAVWASSLMKARIANGSWRFIHWFSWLAVVAAIVHGFLSGTDARSGIGLAVVISCASVVVATALWRYLKRPTRSLGRTALSPLAPHQPPQPSAPKRSPREPDRRSRVPR
jgi:DMSO/TMAO reductase YedYZ heme-binding membrane subunit